MTKEVKIDVAATATKIGGDAFRADTATAKVQADIAALFALLKISGDLKSNTKKARPIAEPFKAAYIAAAIKSGIDPKRADTNARAKWSYHATAALTGKTQHAARKEAQAAKQAQAAPTVAVMPAGSAQGVEPAKPASHAPSGAGTASASSAPRVDTVAPLASLQLDCSLILERSFSLCGMLHALPESTPERNQINRAMTDLHARLRVLEKAITALVSLK